MWQRNFPVEVWLAEDRIILPFADLSRLGKGNKSLTNRETCPIEVWLAENRGILPFAAIRSLPPVFYPGLCVILYSRCLALIAKIERLNVECSTYVAGKLSYVSVCLSV